MPLCTVEIDRRQFEKLSRENRNQTAINICEKALDETLNGLGIPDPQDREWRINVNNGITQANISLGFTLGTDEYKTGKIFDPSTETIKATGKIVYEAASNSSISVSRVTMEPWRNTTFLIRSDEKAGDIVSPSPEILEKTGQVVGRPVVTIALSPEKNEEMAVSKMPEAEKESDAFQIAAKDILRLVSESLQLPDEIKGQAKILLPQLAQTDISLEVDFPQAVGGEIPNEIRQYLAKIIERYLNENQLTKNGSATVWVRSGGPETQVIE